MIEMDTRRRGGRGQKQRDANFSTEGWRPSSSLCNPECIWEELDGQGWAFGVRAPGLLAHREGVHRDTGT